jgi:glutathione-regulated potassium-efflux system ancillary protein KefF
MILIISAHPYPQHSRASRALLDAVRDLSNIEIRSLYDLYPDFDIDIEAEQAALMRADLVVWLHPIYWYSVPAILKHYFDVVLARGWAYGEDGAALRGKHCMWAATTGGQASAYQESGAHQFPFEVYEAPVRQTAKFCGMVWERPLALHGAHVVSEDEIAASANQFRQRLVAWQELKTHQQTKQGEYHAD